MYAKMGQCFFFKKPSLNRFEPQNKPFGQRKTLIEAQNGYPDVKSLVKKNDSERGYLNRLDGTILAIKKL